MYFPDQKEQKIDKVYKENFSKCTNIHTDV